MVILVDSREQDELTFSSFGEVLDIRRVGLPFGDYGALYTDKSGEHKSPIFFERKSLSDLWGTLTNDERHVRFKNRINEAKEVGAKLILAIEGSDADVMAGIDRSKFSGESMMRMLMTLWVRYDLEPMFCSSRPLMAWRMVNLWASWERNYEVAKR